MVWTGSLPTILAAWGVGGGGDQGAASPGDPDLLCSNPSRAFSYPHRLKRNRTFVPVTRAMHCITAHTVGLLRLAQAAGSAGDVQRRLQVREDQCRLSVP